MSNLKYKHTAYTSAQWASLNPVIVENEIVIESDTKRTKIGNGISTYNELEYADANSVGNSLGSIKPTDAAPTPARNGNYTFSIGGNKPAWLTAEAGVTEVKAGDGVAVVYTAPSSYTYTHVDVSSEFVTIQELKDVEDLFVILPNSTTKRLINGYINFKSGDAALVFNRNGQYCSIAECERNISDNSVLVLSSTDGTYTEINHSTLSAYTSLFIIGINIANWNVLGTLNGNDILFISLGGTLEWNKQVQLQTKQDYRINIISDNIFYYKSGNNFIIKIPAGTFCLAENGVTALITEQQLNVETNKVVLLSTTPNVYTPASKTKLIGISLYLVILPITSWGVFAEIDFEDILFINNNGGVFWSKTPNLTKFESKWAGKKIGFLGDSITAGTLYPITGIVEKYVDRYAEKTKCIAINYGVGGTSLAEWIYGSTDDMGHRFTEMANDLDVVIVFGGINDQRGDYNVGLAIPIGTYNDINLDGSLDATFFGGLHKLMRGLKDKYVGKPIIFMTPPHFNYTGSERINDSDTNMTLLNSDGIIEDHYKSNGAPLSDYVDAIKKCASFYGIYVLDTYRLLWNPAITIDFNTYTVDGIHPNDLGCEKIANILYSFLETI